MIEKLSTPVTPEAAPYAEATHRGWGFTLQPWIDPPLRSYSVLGVLDDDGDFRPIPGTENYEVIEGEDLDGIAELAPACEAVKACHEDMPRRRQERAEAEEERLRQEREAERAAAAEAAAAEEGN